jgi:hypothetical protein
MHYASYLIEEAGDTITNPKVKRDIANTVMPLIERVMDPTEQVGYKEWLAGELGFNKYKLTVVLPDGKRREV